MVLYKVLLFFNNIYKTNLEKKLFNKTTINERFSLLFNTSFQCDGQRWKQAKGPNDY